VYSTCIFCHSSLGSNPLIESCPIGQRLAFDPAKGRLWVVCRNCERWNLTPFEERWEALEDCERRFRGTRLRFSTSNIGLARLAPGLDLVRIGSPLRPEMAAWRYGDQFGRRRRKYLITSGALLLTVPAALYFSTIGLAALGVSAGGLLTQLTIGLSNAIKKKRSLGSLPVGKLNTVKLTRHLLDEIEIRPDSTELGWQLHIPDASHEGYPHRLSGSTAIDALQRVLPLINYRGAGSSTVQSAVTRLEAAPEPGEHLLRMARHPAQGTWYGYTYQLRNQRPEVRMALEMLLREDLEERSMTGELYLLEREWRAAEEVAGIADSLLVDPEVSGRLDAMHKDEASTDRDA
jgi:hypothetical protein